MLMSLFKSRLVKNSLRHDITRDTNVTKVTDVNKYKQNCSVKKTEVVERTVTIELAAEGVILTPA